MVDLGAQSATGPGKHLAVGSDRATHGFGVKTRGLLATNRFTSADSLAWSYAAAHSDPLPRHQHRHCNNCRTTRASGATGSWPAPARSATDTWQECLPIAWDPAA